VIEGYDMACKKTLEILPDCVCASAKDLHDLTEATALIRPAIMSKQYGNEDFLADLIAQACGESGALVHRVYANPAHVSRPGPLCIAVILNY